MKLEVAHICFFSFLQEVLFCSVSIISAPNGFHLEIIGLSILLKQLPFNHMLILLHFLFRGLKPLSLPQSFKTLNGTDNYHDVSCDTKSNKL